MGKLVSLTQARNIRQELRKRGKIVVFTNGVFDLLHIGHVRYLQAARKLGHTLFVGLNSDQSTRNLKGPGRPLVPQAERAEILCALACVDYVVIFEEVTAEHVVETLQPDIYVKGGDYAGKASDTGQMSQALPEAAIVRRYGGRIVILPYIPGHSTSQLVANILNRGNVEQERSEATDSAHTS